MPTGVYPRPMTRGTEKLIKLIIRRYLMGFTTYQVSDSLKISQSSVCKWLRFSGVPRRKRSDYYKGAEATFWSKVNKRGPIPAHCPELGRCWIWTAGKDKDGYGQFHYRNEKDESINIRAHRFSYRLAFGELSDSKPCVCHHCDNPACIRPIHLFAGSNLDNDRDKDQKGRRPLGEDSARAKFTNAQVLQIRKLYSSGKMNQRELGERFGASQLTISRIVRKINYKEEAA